MSDSANPSFLYIHVTMLTKSSRVGVLQNHAVSHAGKHVVTDNFQSYVE